jgi:hypothetical protein
MRFLFRASNSIEAQSLRDLLDADSIASTIRNETTALFGEGIIHTEGMPEIWVEEEHFEQAINVKRDWLEQRKVSVG